MGAAIFFILIGSLDVLALIVLMLKLYRLSVGMYWRSLLILCVSAAVVSYFIRIVWCLPMLDTAVLMIIIILYFRYVMDIKFFYAALVSSAGMSAYVVIQLAVAVLYMLLGSYGQTVIVESHGFQVQLIQATSIVSAYLLSYILKLCWWGFSFIPLPPHDFKIKIDYTNYKALVIATTGALIFISFSLVLLLNYKMYLLIPSAMISFGLSYYFSKRRDLKLD